MGWSGSTTFDSSYYWAQTSNYSAFWEAFSYLHQILDDDGTGVAPSDPWPAQLPANGDYFAVVGTNNATLTSMPVGASLDSVKPGQPVFYFGMMQRWIERNLSQFVATAIKTGGSWAAISTYAGKANLYAWGTSNTSGSSNLYEYIGVIGTDGSGLQTGFTRRRPAWITNISGATTFIDDAGNSTNTPVIADVAYRTTDGLKYVYAGSGNWTLGTDQGAAVRVLTGVGIARIGDYVGGPWLWQELHDAILQLRWTRAYNNAFLGIPGGALATVNSYQRYGRRASSVSEATAKGLAHGDYDAVEVSGVSQNRVASYIHDHLSATSPSWDAYIERNRSQVSAGSETDAQATTTPPFARSWDFYYRTTTTGGYPLDALGTALDTSGNLAFWVTEGPTSASKTTSVDTLIPGTTDPLWPTTVTVSNSVEHDVEGGAVVSQYEIVFRWDGSLPYL